jgi:phosphinothricin acetyltransferase
MGTTPLAIRLALDSDLPAIFAIYDEQVLHGTATFETVPRPPEQHADWLRQHPPTRYPALVAETDRGVVGWATLSAWSPRQAYARTAESSVYIHKDHRGQGIGLALMRDIIALAPGLGIRQVIARLAEGNEASVRLHESLGFTTLGVMRRVGEKFGRVLDVRMMQLSLE